MRGFSTQPGEHPFLDICVAFVLLNLIWSLEALLGWETFHPFGTVFQRMLGVCVGFMLALQLTQSRQKQSNLRLPNQTKINQNINHLSNPLIYTEQQHKQPPNPSRLSCGSWNQQLFSSASVYGIFWPKHPFHNRELKTQTCLWLIDAGYVT